MGEQSGDRDKSVQPGASRTWLEAFAMVQDREVTERRLGLVRLAEATRRIIEGLVSADIPLEEVNDAAELVERAAGVLEEYPRQRDYIGFAESANSGDSSVFFDRSPVIGRENPLAPPLVIEPVRSEDGTVSIRGTGVFGSAYEGPPRCVHGGYLAAAFDEVCGMAQSLSGAPGMTARLSVNYRKPTPLSRELEFEGILEKVEGRKIYTTGRCYYNGELTAEAEALFITVDFARINELMKERDD